MGGGGGGGEEVLLLLFNVVSYIIYGLGVIPATYTSTVKRDLLYRTHLKTQLLQEVKSPS